MKKYSAVYSIYSRALQPTLEFFLFSSEVLTPRTGNQPMHPNSTAKGE